MYMLFDWCQNSGVLNVFKIIKTLLNIVRFAVPIGLVLMTTLDIAKNVINPEDKESRKAIVNRLFAAIIVFLLPTLVNIIMNIVDIGLGSGTGYDYNVSDCWKNAG